MHLMTQKLSKALSLFFIVFGGAFLLRNLGFLTEQALDVLWPILFVLLGAYLWTHKG